MGPRAPAAQGHNVLVRTALQTGPGQVGRDIDWPSSSKCALCSIIPQCGGIVARFSQTRSREKAMKTLHKISRQRMEMKTRATVVTQERVPLFVVGDATVAFRRNCDRTPRVFGVGVFRTPAAGIYSVFEILSPALQTTHCSRPGNPIEDADSNATFLDII